MTRYLFALLFASLVFVTAFGRADDEVDQPKKENPDTPRLKRKKRDNPPAVKEDKDKSDKDKAKEDDRKDKDTKKDKKGKDKAKDDEELVPEDGPMGEPQEDEKDVLERVNRNMRSVEEKLGNREVGDPTIQQQRDVLKDLDDLIRRSQQQEQGGGGGADQQPQGGEDQDKNDQKQQGGAKQQQRGQKQGQKQQARAQRQPRQNRQMVGGQQPKQDQGEGKGQKQGKQPQKGGGNDPGNNAKGDGPKNDKQVDDKLYKDVWGHLPESLRAEMNAYSNPKPFMPRYDDLIKKYYRTIAEQGRKKGD
jgi:hypothetical protein